MDFVAVVGACTGVVALGLSIYNTRRQVIQDTPRLRLKLSFGIYHDTMNTANILTIGFTNIGGCNVFVSSCYLEIEGSELKSHLIPRELPRMLEPKNSCSEFWFIDSLKDSLAKEGLGGELVLTGIGTDATGKTFRSTNMLTIIV